LHLSDGGIFILNYWLEDGSSIYTSLLSRFDSSLNLIRQKETTEVAGDMFEMSDGEILFIYGKLFLARMNSNFDILSIREVELGLDQDSSHSSYSLRLCSGDFVKAYHYYSSNTSDYNLLLCKFDSNSNIISKVDISGFDDGLYGRFFEFSNGNLLYRFAFQQTTAYYRQKLVVFGKDLSLLAESNIFASASSYLYAYSEVLDLEDGEEFIIAYFNTYLLRVARVKIATLENITYNSIHENAYPLHITSDINNRMIERGPKGALFVSYRSRLDNQAYIATLSEKTLQPLLPPKVVDLTDQDAIAIVKRDDGSYFVVYSMSRLYVREYYISGFATLRYKTKGIFYDKVQLEIAAKLISNTSTAYVNYTLSVLKKVTDGEGIRYIATALHSFVFGKMQSFNGISIEDGQLEIERSIADTNDIISKLQLDMYYMRGDAVLSHRMVRASDGVYVEGLTELTYGCVGDELNDEEKCVQRILDGELQQSGGEIVDVLKPDGEVRDGEMRRADGEARDGERRDGEVIILQKAKQLESEGGQPEGGLSSAEVAGVAAAAGVAAGVGGTVVVIAVSKHLAKTAAKSALKKVAPDKNKDVNGENQVQNSVAEIELTMQVRSTNNLNGGQNIQSFSLQQDLQHSLQAEQHEDGDINSGGEQVCREDVPHNEQGAPQNTMRKDAENLAQNIAKDQALDAVTDQVLQKDGAVFTFVSATIFFAGKQLAANLVKKDAQPAVFRIMYSKIDKLFYKILPQLQIYMKEQQIMLCMRSKGVDVVDFCEQGVQNLKKIQNKQIIYQESDLQNKLSMQIIGNSELSVARKDDDYSDFDNDNSFHDHGFDNQKFEQKIKDVIKDAELHNVKENIDVILSQSARQSDHIASEELYKSFGTENLDIDVSDEFNNESVKQTQSEIQNKDQIVTEQCLEKKEITANDNQNLSQLQDDNADSFYLSELNDKPMDNALSSKISCDIDADIKNCNKNNALDDDNLEKSDSRPQQRFSSQINMQNYSISDEKNPNLSLANPAKVVAFNKMIFLSLHNQMFGDAVTIKTISNDDAQGNELFLPHRSENNIKNADNCDCKMMFVDTCDDKEYRITNINGCDVADVLSNYVKFNLLKCSLTSPEIVAQKEKFQLSSQQRNYMQDASLDIDLCNSDRSDAEENSLTNSANKRTLGAEDTLRPALMRVALSHHSRF
jgi:hypothetical protein